jgi:adenine-specific DNA-methyltransferase
MTYRVRAKKSKLSQVMERLTGWSAGTSTTDILRGGKVQAARQARELTTKRRTAFAATFAAAIVERYWKEIQAGYDRPWSLPAFPTESDCRTLSEEAKWLAGAIGRAAASVDPVTAGYFIGTTYAAALPTDVRARFGVYYTPPALAGRLLDQATAAGVDWSCCSVLDPACGGGAFLAPVAQRIVKQLSHLEPDVLLERVTARVRGFEIDPVAAWLSQVFLEAVLLPACRAANRRLPALVEVRDSLTAPPHARLYDLVIGNPPYGRVTLDRVLRARYAASLYGHANQYGLFTDIALQLVRPGGVVAYVTPTSFLAGEYFKNLRRLLARGAPPVAIDFIAHRKGVFDDVLQEALLATYRRGQGPDEVSVHFLIPLDESVVQVLPAGTFTLPAAPDEPWLIPRNLAQASLIERMRTMPHRLADWGYAVSTGPLVWNRHKNQLRRTPGPSVLPLVWAEAVTPEGQFIFRATKTNHQPFFAPRAGDGWLIATETCVLVQRTTAKEQRRRLIAAVLPAHFLRQHGGTVVENHLNMVRPLRSPPVVNPAVLAAFLNSPIVDQAFRCLSGSVAVSAYELEALPIPSPDALSDLSAAVVGGASRAVIDTICARLYALT